MTKRTLIEIGQAALLVAGLAGCASAPVVPLPYVLEGNSARTRIQLEASAQIIVGQPIKAGQKCEKVKSELRATVKGIKKDEQLPLTLSCTEVKGAVALVSPLVGKGPYLVEVSGGREPNFTDTPSVVIRYPDPDFNSGTEQEYAGAKEIEANQTVKGVENYSAGMSTQWFKVKGKKATVGLTFFEEGEGRWLSAQVYQLGDGAKMPKLVGVLVPKKKKEFKLDEDNLYVKVTAREFGAERKFSLLRHDGAKGRAMVKIGVIDAYPVSDSAAVVLLRANDALKPNGEVSVYGKRANGETIFLGKCTVGSIAEGQVSCRLDEAKLSNIVDYRAEVAATGGQAS